eukprot:Gb_25173 [translate_table: standard]
MKLDKSRGPDGLQVNFFRASWEIIKEDLLKCCEESRKSSKILGRMNTTLIALIPKEKNPSTSDRFRPISLCNVYYKIITKLMENRLKGILPKLISEEQGGFVQGKQIADNVILVQEALHSACCRKGNLMLIKLDMAKAYDCLDITFLLKVLERFGFCRGWRNWVEGCISNPSFLVLVNGSPVDFFKSDRGIRQGCPLSPSLFILMAKSLGRMLKENAERGLLEGAEVTTDCKRISHAQFMDDTILMGTTTMENAKIFKEVLDTFLLASGGRVNENKSFIYMMNSSVRLHSRICRLMGFQRDSFEKPISYLGAPLSPSLLRSKDWLPLLDKFQHKVEGWSYGWLNLVAKVTLIRSMLASYPIFLCSFIAALKKVLESFEKVMRSFLWKGGKEKQRIHLVNWDVVCKSKRRGGLGIRKLEVMAKALGGKQVWRLGTGQ